jgi:hypothetical protein
LFKSYLINLLKQAGEGSSVHRSPFEVILGSDLRFSGSSEKSENMRSDPNRESGLLPPIGVLATLRADPKIGHSFQHRVKSLLNRIPDYHIQMIINLTLVDRYHRSPFSGTSAVAPHPAGIEALVLSADPSTTTSEMRYTLIRSAVDPGDPDFRCGEKSVSWATAGIAPFASGYSDLDRSESGMGGRGHGAVPVVRSILPKTGQGLDMDLDQIMS